MESDKIEGEDEVNQGPQRKAFVITEPNPKWRSQREDADSYTLPSDLAIQIQIIELKK